MAIGRLGAGRGWDAFCTSATLCPFELRRGCQGRSQAAVASGSKQPGRAVGRGSDGDVEIVSRKALVELGLAIPGPMVIQSAGDWRSTVAQREMAFLIDNFAIYV